MTSQQRSPPQRPPPIGELIGPTQPACSSVDDGPTFTGREPWPVRQAEAHQPTAGHWRAMAAAQRKIRSGAQSLAGTCSSPKSGTSRIAAFASQRPPECASVMAPKGRSDCAGPQPHDYVRTGRKPPAHSKLTRLCGSRAGPGAAPSPRWFDLAARPGPRLARRRSSIVTSRFRARNVQAADRGSLVAVGLAVSEYEADTQRVVEGDALRFPRGRDHQQLVADLERSLEADVGAPVASHYEHMFGYVSSGPRYQLAHSLRCPARCRPGSWVAHAIHRLRGPPYRTRRA
jgi:hypothetical protein